VSKKEEIGLLYGPLGDRPCASVEFFAQYLHEMHDKSTGKLCLAIRLIIYRRFT